MGERSGTLIVCGGGLAGLLTASHLAARLGQAYEIVLLEDACDQSSDVYYGSVTAPSGYEFYRSAGLDEPTLFRLSSTSFSFGTEYVNWPSRSATWMQCHHLPFPVPGGVPLQHHLTREGLALEPLLISAVAARKGAFAHPPQDPTSALSRAEYGYQFSVGEWADLLRQRLDARRVRRMRGEIAEIEVDGEDVQAIRLSDGERVTGDLFIDCTGPQRNVLNAVGGVFERARSISASHSVELAGELGPPCRTVVANANGWTSTTRLQDGVHTLSVTRGDGAGPEAASSSIDLGRVDQAWRGNCVAIGHSAAVLEPLTVAPMILLQRDIERLLELIPSGADHSMERREFNRRFRDDAVHAQLFESAFFRFERELGGSYWKDAAAAAASEGLDRKLAHFEHRGLLVKYDLEPFDDEDWMILHAGMGRRPSHHDRQLDGTPDPAALRQLSDMKQTVEQMASRMPPHHVYVASMKRYLEKQRNV